MLKEAQPGFLTIGSSKCVLKRSYSHCYSISSYFCLLRVKLGDSPQLAAGNMSVLIAWVVPGSMEQQQTLWKCSFAKAFVS